MQQRLGFPRFRLSLLLDDGSWEELQRPREIQVVFNQVGMEQSEALLRLGVDSKRLSFRTAIYQEDEDAVRRVLQHLGWQAIDEKA